MPEPIELGPKVPPVAPATQEPEVKADPNAGVASAPVPETPKPIPDAPARPIRRPTAEAQAVATFSADDDSEIQLMPNGTLRFNGFEPDPASKALFEFIIPRTVSLMQVQQLVGTAITQSAMGRIQLCISPRQEDANNALALQVKLIQANANYNALANQK